jgi:hypothetical protein
MQMPLGPKNEALAQERAVHQERYDAHVQLGEEERRPQRCWDTGLSVTRASGGLSQRRLVGDTAGQRNPGVATRRINARAEQGLSSPAQWSAQARHPALGSFIDAQLVPAVGSHRRRFGPARRGSDRASLGMPRAHVVLHSLLVTRGRHSHGRRRDTLHEPRHPAAHGRTVF